MVDQDHRGKEDRIFVSLLQTCLSDKIKSEILCTHASPSTLHRNPFGLKDG